MSRDEEIVKEMQQANVPLTSLSTTLTQLKQRAVREWVSTRGWEEDGAFYEKKQGLWLHNAVDNPALYRRVWHRLAAELVLAGQNVFLTNTVSLGSVVVFDSEENFEALTCLQTHEHLFLDQFCYNNSHAGNPMPLHQRHGLRTFITDWVEQGKAIYPYVETSDLNVVDEWWGGDIWVMEDNTTKIDITR